MTRISLARALGALGLLGIGLLWAGCKGIPTDGERQARRQLEHVGAGYRPHGEKPPLPELTPQSGLSNYLEYALLNQPAVEAAYYDWAASVERITTARSFPDPQFTFQMDIQNAVTSVMPGLMGAIPWPSKLRLGAQVASAESRAKYFAYQGAVLENAYAVKRAYYELYFLAERIRVNQEMLRLLGDLEQLARAQNEVGKGTLQDVLRAQIEQDRLRTDLANLEDSRGARLAQFKAALGLKAGEPDPPVPQRLESTPLELSAEQVLDKAFAQNQRLKALEAEVRAEDASLALARTARYPDFNLGLMADAKTDPTLYRVPGGPGTMTLPVWRDKIAAQIAEAEANRHSARARVSAEQLNLAAELTEETYVYRQATRTLELLKGQLLPKATESLEVARSGYLAGQIDFFNLTDSERTLLSLKLDEVEAGQKREVVLAELSLVIQGMTPVSGPVTETLGAGSAGAALPGTRSPKSGGM